VKLLFQVFVGQWSRIDLGSKSMVKFNFSQVNNLTAVADHPTVSMFVTPPWSDAILPQSNHIGISWTPIFTFAKYNLALTGYPYICDDHVATA